MPPVDPSRTRAPRDGVRSDNYGGDDGGSGATVLFMVYGVVNLPSRVRL